MTDPSVAMPGASDGGGGPGAIDGRSDGGEGEGDARRGRWLGRGRGGRWLWVVAGVAGVAAAVVLALLAWAARPVHHAAPKVTPAALPPVKPLVGAAGGELVALLQAGQATSYHARYHVAGDPAKIGGSQDLEVWNAPPRRRADAIGTNDGHIYRSETFVDGKSSVLCLQQDTAPWSCQRVAGKPAAGSELISTSVVAATSGRPVVVTTATVSGRKVRCFAISGSVPGDSPLRICATEGGVPVVIENSAVSYQLVSLDAAVPGATFTTPAAVR